MPPPRLIDEPETSVSPVTAMLVAPASEIAPVEVSAALPAVFETAMSMLEPSRVGVADAAAQADRRAGDVGKPRHRDARRTRVGNRPSGGQRGAAGGVRDGDVDARAFACRCCRCRRPG